MSFTEDFLTGVCQTLEAGSAGPHALQLVLTEDDVYNPELPVISWSLKTELERSVVVSSYTIDDDIDRAESVVGIQFEVTGPSDMAFVNATTDRIFDLFHGLQATTLGGVKVIQAERRSGALMGQDERGRVSRSENFYFTVHRPSPNRF